MSSRQKDTSKPNTLSRDQLIELIRKGNKSHTDVKSLDEHFRQIGFFKNCYEKLSTDQYKRLLKALDYEKVRKNQFLYHQGDKGNKFYVVLSGHVRVIVKKKNPPQPVSTAYRKYVKKVCKLVEQAQPQRIGAARYTQLLGSIIPTLARKNDRGRNQLTGTMMMNPAMWQQAFKKLEAGITEDEENVVLDQKLEKFTNKVNPKSKLSKSKCILGYHFVKVWTDYLAKTQDNLGQNKLMLYLFTPYRQRKYWINLLLYGLINADLDFFDHLFPRVDRVFQYSAGGTFGEIAILRGGIRTAGIYCDEETEFAVIQKKKDNDFLFLYRALQKEREAILKNLSPFNYWIVRDKVSALFHLLDLETKPIDYYIYRRGRLF